MDDERYEAAEAGGVAQSPGDSDIDQLLRARGDIDSALRRHKAQVAVLFTDIVGSTSFFERYGDTAGLLMLQRHHELVLPAIEEGAGTVVKTIGDAVLATFSSAETAVRTAIQIQRRLDSHNEERLAADQIYTRIGVNFGSGYVKDRDVFGDVVNVAARFVKACAPAQILVSRTIFDSIGGAEDISCRKLGTTSFHGKTEPEDIYEVIWTSPDRYERVRKQFDTGKAGTSTKSVLGRYELLEELGRGAMGVVHKAYDPAVGRIVALKTVRLDVTGSDREELIRRLRQEAQAAGRLEHPHIVTIYDAGEAEGVFYLTMQFVKGSTLAELISTRSLLPVKQIVLMFEQLCEGLHYAHERGIVHRDLKPTNIIVTPEGAAKILDFGIAKVAESGTTKAGLILGTPSYMSPEQAQGGRVDRRSDIFALGAMLYELLTGEKPFPANTPTAVIYKILHEEPIPPRAVEPTIDPALERVVRTALAKSPFERYQTCQELQEDLKNAGRETPQPSAKKAAAMREPKPRAPRAPRKAAAAAAPAPAPVAPATGTNRFAIIVGALLVVGMAVFGWQQDWFSSKPSPPQTQRVAPSKPPAPAPAEQPPVQAVPQAPAKTTAPSDRPAKAEVKKPKPEEGPSEAAVQESKPPRTATPPKSSLSSTQQQEISSWLRQAEQYVGRGEYN
ncbi:MAG: protein kinase domain-containing protein, partial [Candidatus Acidiferrales bacterium]